MTKLLLFVAALLMCLLGKAQDDFAAWDKKYLPKDYQKLIAEEKAYEAEVRNQEKVPHDYSRFDTYRMRGRFTGKSRPIDPKVLQSMKFVCWTWPKALPKPETLNKLTEKEYLFRMSGAEVWMPIQKILEVPLRDEVQVGEVVTLLLFILE